MSGEGGLFGSWKVGEVAGIPIKVHTLFVLWLIWTLSQSQDLSLVIVWNLILFGSVFLHELGHCAGARLVGGAALEVILYPLGGLSRLRTPARPSAELISTAGGPLVNLVLAVLGLGLLALGGLLHEVQEGAWSLSRALRLAQGESTLGAIGLMLGATNLLLFLFNVIPAFPMDGGKIFRALAWPIVGWRNATLAATSLGMLIGGVFALLALASQPPRMFLLLIGLWVGWSSYQEFQRVRTLPPAPWEGDDRMPFER